MIRTRSSIRSRRGWLKLVAGLVLALAVGVANAMTLSQAIKKVQRDTGGKVLSAQTRVERNREIHIIRVLTPDGRVRQIRVPGDRVENRRKDKPNARAGR